MPEQNPENSPIPEPVTPPDKEAWAALAERLAVLEKRLQILEAKFTERSPSEQASQEPGEAGGTFDLERRFGGPLLNYLGLFALLVGLALLIGYWMEAHTLAAILLACLSAGGLAGLGRWLGRRGSEAFSMTLEGTALGLLYVVCYLLYGWGGLVLSLGASAGVMLLAITRAIRRNSQLLAVFVLLAAVLGPLLLGSVRSGEGLLFGYLAAVNGGAVWAGRRKGWIGLRFLALLGTHFVAWFWYLKHPGAQPALTAAFPLLTFFLFARIVPAVSLTSAEVVLGIANSACLLAASASLLHIHYPVMVSFPPLALATVHLLWGLIWMRSVAFRRHAPLHLWLSAFLFALGIALVLPAPGMAAGWTAEAFFLGWIGVRQNSIPLRSAGMLLALAAAVAIVSALNSSQEGLLESLTTVGAVAFSASILALRRLSNRREVKEDNWEWAANALLALLATILPMLVLSRLGSLGGESRFLSVPPQLLISFLWAGYSVALCLLGWFYLSAFLRWMGVILLVITTVKVFLVDPVALSGVARIVSFLLLSVFLLFLSYVFQTRRR